VGLAIAILLCDQILKEYDQLLDLAWKLEASLSTSTSQKTREIKMFINFLQGNPPRFVAARFFTIDKSTLFKMLNTSITFLLVTIQFD
jgi:gustatory receptor